jgi:hypothetical protein
MDRWTLLALAWVYSCFLGYAVMGGDSDTKKAVPPITTGLVSGLLGFIARKEIADH